MLDDCRVDARFFPAPDDLDGCLTSIYRLDFAVPSGGRIEDCLQPEWGNVRAFSGMLPESRIAGRDSVTGARLTITGPSSLPNHFSLGTTRMWGVGLLPLGWARLVRKPAERYANLSTDGEQHPDFAGFRSLPLIFGEREAGADRDEAEYARIVAVLRALDHPVADETVIRATHAAMTDPEIATVGAFAEAAGLPLRRLERVCRRHFGFPPKLLLRRQRFMRSLAQFMVGGAGNWTSSMDGLYTDQAHFNRDFHAFMGMAPTEYAARSHPVLEAFMRERARQLGSPAQTLDPPRPLR